MPAYNKLFINLACLVFKRNIGPRSFCDKPPPTARSVQKRPRSDISLQRPRARLIRSYYYMASVTSGQIACCDWLKSIFSGPLLSRNGPAVHYGKKIHKPNSTKSKVK